MLKQKTKTKPGRAVNQDGHNEGDLVKLIIAFLSKNDFKVWRQQNTGSVDAAQLSKKLKSYVENMIITREQKLTKGLKADPNFKLDIEVALLSKDVFSIVANSYKAVTGAMRGVADIIGWNKNTGTWIAVEIKINEDKLSEAQIAFANELRDAGGNYITAKTYNQFKESFYKQFPTSFQ
jgi:hypothetical protein